MAIYIGSNKMQSALLGQNKVKEIWLGENRVYQSKRWAIKDGQIQSGFTFGEQGGKYWNSSYKDGSGISVSMQTGAIKLSKAMAGTAHQTGLYWSDELHKDDFAGFKNLHITLNGQYQSSYSANVGGVYGGICATEGKTYIYDLANGSYGNAGGNDHTLNISLSNLPDIFRIFFVIAMAGSGMSFDYTSYINVKDVWFE